MKFEPFENIFKDSTSNFTKVKKEDYQLIGTYPIIDQGQAFIGGFTDDEKLIVNKNLPVIIFGDHTKVFKYVDFPFTIGADGVKVLALRNEKDNALFYYYFLKSIKIVDKGYSRHFKYLKEKKLPVLNYANQLHIANLLSKAENLIAQRKESIRLLDEYLKSTFLEMFGSMNEKNFPLERLYDVSSKINDGEHGSVEKIENGVLYLMARNITHNNTIDFKEISYVSKKAHNKMYKRCNPEAGDILIVCVGATIGKVAIVPKMEEFSIARSVALVKPNYKRVNSQYLLGFFNSEYAKRQIKKSSLAAAQAGLYIGKIKEIKIPIPPISLQTQFAQIVEKSEVLKTQYQQSLQELEKLYGSLSQKAFRGELSVKDDSLLMTAEPLTKYGI